jgi:uncharacterized protein with HEPN domain
LCRNATFATDAAVLGIERDVRDRRRRRRLVYDYMGVDLEIVRDTATRVPPALDLQLRKLPRT